MPPNCQLFELRYIPRYLVCDNIPDRLFLCHSYDQPSPRAEQHSRQHSSREANTVPWRNHNLSRHKPYTTNDEDRHTNTFTNRNRQSYFSPLSWHLPKVFKRRP